MSLLKADSKHTENREELTTERTVIENQRIKTRAYQKEHRERTVEAYREEKSIVDNLNSNDLTNYIVNNVDSQHEVRTGLHAMKINSYEHAIIKNAIELSGSRGSRELYIRLCKQVISSYE